MQVYIRLLFLEVVIFKELGNSHCTQFQPYHHRYLITVKSNELRFNESPGSSYLVTEVCSLSSVMYTGSLYCMLIFNQFNLIIVNILVR